MLKIRLSRQGRKGRPFYRVVLTEHTKPAKSGFTDVFGWFDPLAHKLELNIDLIKEWIGKGAQPSERVAKLIFAQTKDVFFKKFYEERTRTAAVKNEKK
jgi:small subunit ribosomal protein S16